MERGENGLEEKKHVKRDSGLIVSFVQGLLDTGQNSQNPGAQYTQDSRHHLVTQQTVSLTQELGSDYALARKRIRMGMRMEWTDTKCHLEKYPWEIWPNLLIWLINQI